MLSWRFAPFEKLTPREVHDLFQARVGVFVLEQGCAFQDVDGADPQCWHLLGFAPVSAEGRATSPVPMGEGRAMSASPLGEGRPMSASPSGEGRGGGPLVAYCRIVPPGVKFPEPSIGRVLTTAGARRTGAGRELMREAVARIAALWPGKPIRIGAQRYLERFYGDFGFVKASEPYDEDGIVHIEMVRSADHEQLA
jgi:ElaA protein